ncbi:hypothetical protein Sango_0810400 [Sesamum angolense]|uniref:Transposase n=1 Tax=Sesamum angolense TaxID=2727404 RepID=A0AAE2C0D6_9LAMI|nr:hypothetical protein Sango_0810400 [Sesamum angolense]
MLNEPEDGDRLEIIEDGDSIFDSDYDMVFESIDYDDLFDKYVDGEGDMVRLSNVEGDGSSYPAYNPVESYDPTFELGMIFSSKTEFKKDQAYRAKMLALKKLEGSPEYQYSRLWNYAKEVRKTNFGSTVILGAENKNGEVRFNRFYVCFNALKTGFLGDCRSIIGVDGAHIKGVHGGVLMTAVRVDPNNNTYPIAYAVVRNECNET